MGRKRIEVELHYDDRSGRINDFVGMIQKVGRDDIYAETKGISGNGKMKLMESFQKYL